MWFRIPAPGTGWTFFTFICCKKLYCLFEKTKNKQKRGRGWPIFFKKRVTNWLRRTTTTLRSIQKLNLKSANRSIDRYRTKMNQNLNRILKLFTELFWQRFKPAISYSVVCLFLIFCFALLSVHLSFCLIGLRQTGQPLRLGFSALSFLISIISRLNWHSLYFTAKFYLYL